MNCYQLDFFEEFADPTLLIWGDKSGLERFSTVLRTAHNSGSVLSISDLPWIVVGTNLKMSIEISVRDSGISAEMMGGSMSFRWKLSPDKANSFAAEIDAVAGANRPCHQYLEFDNMDEVVVMVSKGEYDDLRP